MDLSAVWAAFVASPSGYGIVAVLVCSFLVLIFGVSAAMRDGTFEWGLVAAWVRKHLWGRVIPIVAALFVGYLTGMVAGSGETLTQVVYLGLTGAGIVGAGLYVAETLGAIRDALGVQAGAQALPKPTD